MPAASTWCGCAYAGPRSAVYAAGAQIPVLRSWRPPDLIQDPGASAVQ